MCVICFLSARWDSAAGKRQLQALQSHWAVPKVHVYSASARHSTTSDNARTIKGYNRAKRHEGMARRTSITSKSFVYFDSASFAILQYGQYVLENTMTLLLDARSFTFLTVAIFAGVDLQAPMNCRQDYCSTSRFLCKLSTTSVRVRSMRTFANTCRIRVSLNTGNLARVVSSPRVVTTGPLVTRAASRSARCASPSCPFDVLLCGCKHSRDRCAWP